MNRSELFTGPSNTHLEDMSVRQIGANFPRVSGVKFPKMFFCCHHRKRPGKSRPFSGWKGDYYLTTPPSHPWPSPTSAVVIRDPSSSTATALIGLTKASWRWVPARVLPPTRLWRTCPPQKGTILIGHFVFQPSIISGYVSVRGSTVLLFKKRKDCWCCWIKSKSVAAHPAFCFSKIFHIIYTIYLRRLFQPPEPNRLPDLKYYYIPAYSKRCC